MKILIADDHGLFAEGLQNLLQAGGHEVAGIAYDGFEALELARSVHPELILMDVRMPNCNGLEATRLVQAELPEIQIVMLTTSAEEADLFEALKSGACGYLLKNLKPFELLDYLVGLERGEAPLSRELASRLLREFVQQAAILDEQAPATGTGEPEGHIDGPVTGAAADVELTPRQREVLEMIAAGMSYKEVGAALHVSENTVKYHMREILQRLHAKNREQVVAYALRHGLIPGDTPPD